MRESGILFPIFSLPSKYGIGCFSREAYDFVDFLYESGQGFWQILPIGPTGFGNSPYQPFSAFAGNPYFISLDALIEDGLLTREEADACFFGSDQEKVDYGTLYENRFPLLKKAFARFQEKAAGDAALQKEYEEYLKEEAGWLTDYALFTTIKEQQNGASWLDWDEPLRTRSASALENAKQAGKDTFDFTCFLQFYFDRQWKKLRAYANKKNVKIIGDLPFYVALDSADAWAHPEVFLMEKDLTPKAVAGCPPDAFSPTGQLWGNPIYDWEGLKRNGYDWWVKRMKRNYTFYDVIRIDHFHGFAEYYAIPYQDKTAENGKQQKGPGMDLFRVLEDQIENLHIIAEDLGTNTPENEKLLADSGFPGMKVLQYGFTSWDSYYVNHRHIQNCVVYTGTHDNTPTRAWVEEIQDHERNFARRYINSIDTDYGKFVWDFIREAYRSVANLCIIPLQDYLCKGKEARINSPGTADGNWQWRLQPNFLSKDLSRSIRELAEIYSRIPAEPEGRDQEESKGKTD